jgi:nucleotide-binding universal stress UspA family protein
MDVIPMIELILLAVDDVEASEKPRQVVAELARATGADVAIYHARRAEFLRNGPRRVETEADAHDVVDETAFKLFAEGIHIRHRLVGQTLGNPGDEIVGTAGKIGASMIVIGTRSGNPVLRSTLGSVAHKVVATSPVPVVTVP